MGMMKKKWLECCTCINEVCRCCPGSFIEPSIFNMRTINPIGPGATGCPQYPLGTAAPFDPNELNLTICSVPEELAALYEEICGAFCLNGVKTFPGSFGNFNYTAILLCASGGNTAYIKYDSGSGALLGLPDDEWIETAGGFECPECNEGDSGVQKPVSMYYDVFVNCGSCNTNDFNYETGFCTPLILYSVRHYFTGVSTCD